MQVQTLTFYSNYFNHHQKALCEAWYAILGDGFTFVETMPMESFREEMGWGESERPYLLKAYAGEEEEKRALSLAVSSDLVVMGTAPERYIRERLSRDLITFRYSERPLKEGFIKFLIPRLTVKYLDLHVKNKKKPLYILAASAFTSLDYHKMLRSYEGKCYRFGYFPEHLLYDIDTLMRQKKEHAKEAPTILWMGRMIRLKRPELVLLALAQLKREGYSFRLQMAGDGEMREKLERMSETLGLSEWTVFHDFYKPREARDVMADAQIYVMTSNKLEGWGSVIYEAQNAGCAQVASHACGATPWLVKNGESGLVFCSGSVESLKAGLKKMLDHPELAERCGRNAYAQMKDLWNPVTAATRVIALAEYIDEKLSAMSPEERKRSGFRVEGSPFADGPCAVAPFLKNQWFSERDGSEA